MACAATVGLLAEADGVADGLLGTAGDERNGLKPS